MTVNTENDPLLLIRLQGLTKDYAVGPTAVHALAGIDLEVRAGEMVAITGASGSGKSTLLSLIGCLDRPSAGRYWLEGKLVNSLSREQLARIRNREIGFVFQTFNLLPQVSALDNVMLPLVYAGLTGQRGRQRALQALDSVGLARRARHKPSQLSGGEQQRVAIARSVVTGPRIILADEPTGNLDSRASVEVMAILQALNDQGITVVVITHGADIASFCSRVITLRNGQMVGDAASDHARRADQVLVEGPKRREPPEEECDEPD